jgi:hypothetical protein
VLNYYGNIKILDFEKSVPNDYKIFYNDDLKKKVYELYKTDIEKYNYEF